MIKDEFILKEQFDNDYHESLASWSVALDEMQTDTQFYLGDQYSEEEKAYLAEEGRNRFVYNYCQRNINLVTGYQRKNRLGFGVDPVQDNDSQKADVAEDLLIWQAQKANFYNTLSDSFEDAAITGLSIVSFGLDFSKDPLNGDVVASAEPFQTYMIDPNFTKLDLSDCRYFMKRKFVSMEEAQGLVPTARKDIEKLKPGVPDSKFSYMSYSRNRYENSLFAYDEYYRRTTKEFTLLTHRQTGMQLKWKGSKDALKFLLSQDPYWQETKGYEPSVEYYILVQNEPMYMGEDPLRIGDFPIVPVVWMYKPQYDDFRYKLQGLIRPIRDAQQEYNRIRSTQVDVIESQPNSGWISEHGAVENEADLFKSGQSQVLKLAPGKVATALQQIRPSEISQGMVHLSQQLNTDILQIAGLNEEAIGVAEQGNTEISGALAKMRTANSITILKSAFDRLELSQKLCGQKILKIMLANYMPQKLAQIVGHPIEQMDIDTVMAFDIVVKEAMLTDTQKTLSYVQALQAKAAGVQIPDSFVLQQMPIANKTELMEAYQQQAQMAEQQQAKINAQEEMQLRLQNAEIVHKLSLAEQQRETAVSRQALAEQHIANSYADRAKALLDNVKAAKEIQGMEQEQLMKSIAFVLQLQDAAGTKEKIQVKETSSESSQDVVAFNQLNKLAGLNGTFNQP